MGAREFRWPVVIDGKRVQPTGDGGPRILAALRQAEAWRLRIQTRVEGQEFVLHLEGPGAEDFELPEPFETRMDAAGMLTE